MAKIVVELYKLGIDPRKMDPDKVMWAFLMGVRYHDALAAGQKAHPDRMGTYGPGTNAMDQAFENWHQAMADALGNPHDQSA